MRLLKIDLMLVSNQTYYMPLHYKINVLSVSFIFPQNQLYISRYRPYFYISQFKPSMEFFFLLFSINKKKSPYKSFSLRTLTSWYYNVAPARNSSSSAASAPVETPYGEDDDRHFVFLIVGPWLRNREGESRSRCSGFPGTKTNISYIYYQQSPSRTAELEI